MELRVRELQQLFNSLDASPFLTKDLARSTETYIESRALPIARGSRLQLTIHVEQLDSAEEARDLMSEAIHNHYGYKSVLVRAELRQLLRQGRISLAIGLAFVTACLLAAEMLTHPAQGAAGSIARESLTIIGWVAMWRPVQIFLYDWWPVVGRIHGYDNLKFARVEVVVAAQGDQLPGSGLKRWRRGAGSLPSPAVFMLSACCPGDSDPSSISRRPIPFPISFAM